MNLFKYTYKLINFLAIPKEVVIIFNKRLSLLIILILLLMVTIISL